MVARPRKWGGTYVDLVMGSEPDCWLEYSTVVRTSSVVVAAKVPVGTALVLAALLAVQVVGVYV